MKTALFLGTVAITCAALLAACSDDDDNAAPTGGSSGRGGSSTGGSKPGPSGGQPSPAEATGAEGGMEATGGGAGGAGGAAPEERCAVDDGQCIFRHDTFGDEQLWTDTLRLHEVVQTLTPTQALGLGLKVDATAVPTDVLASADLEDAATTVALLSLGAVVGVEAKIADGEITSIGITCALCHSTVDDSVMPGIGKRLDGWPNRELDPGAIIAATPGVGAIADKLGITEAQAKEALNSWGPGRYDARLNQDGENFPVWIPPAYGLADVELETYTGEGPVSYWNAYVAVTQMGAHGNFVDEDLGLDIEFTPDLVTPKLPALREYQLSLSAPAPKAGSFNAAAAARGDALFEGAAMCSTCHAGETYTDAPLLHEPEETGMETNEARRSKTGMYRTTPLRGLATHAPYFHDGSAATLADVVDHYVTTLELDLTAAQQADLVEYLKSL